MSPSLAFSLSNMPARRLGEASSPYPTQATILTSGGLEQARVHSHSVLPSLSFA